MDRVHGERARSEGAHPIERLDRCGAGGFPGRIPGVAELEELAQRTVAVLEQPALGLALTSYLLPGCQAPTTDQPSPPIETSCGAPASSMIACSVMTCPANSGLLTLGKT